MSLTTAAVEEASNVQDKSTVQEKSTKEEDENQQLANIGTTSVEMIDLTDTSILEVGTASFLVKYSKEVLLKLKESPFSTQRPGYLDTAYDNNNGIWDPERWHSDRKMSEISNENGSRGNDPDNHRRRAGDPRERIRKEHDGIVLSPQRRSFNSGCYVPVREPAKSNRSHSPIGKGEANSHIGHREISQGPSGRRIGSGRIFFDYQEKTESDYSFGYRKSKKETDKERDERYDRRLLKRDNESNKPKSKDGSFTRSGTRYDRPKVSNEEEPEWFSEGPMSQHDTIELRGFDDSEKLSHINSNKKKTSAQKKKAKERANNTKNSETVSSQNAIFQVTKENSVKKDEPGGRSTPTPQDGGQTHTVSHSPIDKGASGDNDAEQDKNAATGIAVDHLFTIEDMLKSDSIPMLLPNGVGLDSGDRAGSKFSRWFNLEKSSPNKIEGSRRSSIQDDHHHLIKNILNDISEPTVNIPGDSESYFAPISPAANTGGVASNPGVPQPASQPINFMEILQRSGKPQGGPLHADLPPAMKTIEVPGKLLCVEELETRIRQGDNRNAVDTEINLRSHVNGSKPHPKNKEDNSAFQKLLAQMQDGHVIQATSSPIPQQKTQPMSIMEMLSHSQKQEEAARFAQMMNSPVSQAHLATDTNYKLQQSQVQRQIEAFSKLLISGGRQQQARTPPPLNDIGIAGRDLLNRPEAQAILQGLKRGDITPQHLYQQLANPAMQSRHRELLQMILKLQAPNMGPSSRVLSPVPPHPLFQQQQQLRVSPLPPNAMHQRIPSPRELQVHTQNIMQRALIKKKLEEQQENFRKKQELHQGGQSPGGLSPAKNVGSPTQLAFTPTAVLRKMTADKDDGSKDCIKNNDAQNKAHQGRAVTGMRNQTQQTQQQVQLQQVQQVQQQWNTQFQQMNKQPAGRPIVKNNANFQQSPQQYDQLLFQQHRLMNQQQRKQNQFGGALSGQFGGLQQFPNTPQQFSQLPHQLRAQHQHQQNVRAQHQQQQGFGQQQWQQIIQHNQTFADNRQIGRGGGNDGDMSPTSNQLARWFSPDLLERARKGKLPNMPASSRAQHALSLEEIERQTAPVIHN